MFQSPPPFRRIQHNRVPWSTLELNPAIAPVTNNKTSAPAKPPETDCITSAIVIPPDAEMGRRLIYLKQKKKTTENQCVCVFVVVVGGPVCGKQGLPSLFQDHSASPTDVSWLAFLCRGEPVGREEAHLTEPCGNRCAHLKGNTSQH